jgi:hypothetical protein
MTKPGATIGVGVLVGVTDRVGVVVRVGVIVSGPDFVEVVVCVAVAVCTGVAVTVSAAVPSGVLVDVASGVEVTVADAVPDGVPVNVGSGVAVSVGSSVRSDVTVAVGAIVRVAVGCPGRVAVRVTVGAAVSVTVAVASVVGSGVCVFTATVGVVVGALPDESSSFPHAATPLARKPANIRSDNARQIRPPTVVLILLPPCIGSWVTGHELQRRCNKGERRIPATPLVQSAAQEEGAVSRARAVMRTAAEPVPLRDEAISLVNRLDGTIVNHCAPGAKGSRASHSAQDLEL